MTENEALKEFQTQINILQSMIAYNKEFEPKNNCESLTTRLNATKLAISAIKENQQYRSTIKEYREAVERQRAKKPILYKGTNRADCSVCGNTVKGIGKPFGNWCSRCGQAIDWSDAE